MSNSNATRCGHRRPWWQFNVIPLAIALFILVYARHFGALDFATTIRWTLTIGATWATIGLLGLFVRILIRASQAQRLYVSAIAATVLLLGGIFVYPVYRQVSLVTRVWSIDGNQGGGNRVYINGQKFDAALQDPFFRYRCFGRVTRIHLDHTTHALDVSALAALPDLVELCCTIDGDKLCQLADLTQLVNVQLVVDGPADFSCIKHLANSLAELELYWMESGDASLDELIGLPIKSLSLSRSDELSDDEIRILGELPLTWLRLYDGLASTTALSKLRRLRPTCRIWPQVVLDHPEERALVDKLRKLECRLTANDKGRIRRVDVFASDFNEQITLELARLPALEMIALHEVVVGEGAWTPIEGHQALKEVELGECQLVASAWESIGRLPKLQLLYIRDTEIHREALAKLRKSATLRDLIIEESRLGPEEVKELHNFDQLTSLQFRDIYVTRRDIQRLRAALPAALVMLER